MTFEDLTDFALPRLLNAYHQLVGYKGESFRRHYVFGRSSTTNLSKVGWKFHFVQDASI